MVRVIEQIRAVFAVLVLGMSMTLGFDAVSQVMPFGVWHESAVCQMAVHQMLGADTACADVACVDRHADGCSVVQACCSGCAALATLEAASVPAGSGDAWGTSPYHVLSGLEPLVNRHPPRANA